MKEQIETILSSNKDNHLKLLEIDELLTRIVKGKEEDNQVSSGKKVNIIENISIHDFEPIGLFAD